MDSNSTVYTGAWINWTRGPIQGATLTMTSRQGAYLVALMALFVKVVGSQLWNIICFLAFRLRTTTKAEDPLAHQHQAILRNAESESTAIIQTVQAAWHWRKKSTNPLGRSAAIITIATVHLVAILLAGIFSSRVTASTSEVLLRSSNCGAWPYNGNSWDDDVLIDGANAEIYIAWSSCLLQNMARSSASASSCYGSSAQTQSTCGPFAR